MSAQEEVPGRSAWTFLSGCPMVIGSVDASNCDPFEGAGVFPIGKTIRLRCSSCFVVVEFYGAVQKTLIHSLQLQHVCSEDLLSYLCDGLDFLCLEVWVLKHLFQQLMERKSRSIVCTEEDLWTSRLSPRVTHALVVVLKKDPSNSPMQVQISRLTKSRSMTMMRSMSRQSSSGSVFQI